MKVPVGIDLRRASFTLCQFRKGSGFGRGDGSSSKAGTSSSPSMSFHIIASVSAARVNCDRDKAAIFSRSSFFVALSVPPPDSCLILLTSRETCISNISGKLCHEIEHLWVFRAREYSQIGETGKHLIHDVAVYQAVVDVYFGLLLECWYVVLRLMSHKTPGRRKASHHVCESVNRVGGWGWESLRIPVSGSFLWREMMTRI